MNMVLTKQDALDYHAGGRPGKLKITPTKPMEITVRTVAALNKGCSNSASK